MKDKLWMAALLLVVLGAGCSKKEEEAVVMQPLAMEMPATEPATLDAFFNDWPVVHLRITISAEGAASLEKDPRTYVRATIREGEREWTDVGIRLKGREGGSFRALTDKPAMTLNFDKFHKGQTYHSLDRVYLNNSVEDDRYMCEHIAGELFREAGVPAPRVTHAVVELNGELKGLYVLKEGFDENYLRGWFKDPGGNLYDGGEINDVDAPLEKNSGDKEGGREDLEALVAAAREPDLSRRWERLQQVLDVDRFLSFMAMEVLVTQSDGYCLNRNNYRVYHDPGSGKFVFMPHGLDVIFHTPDLAPIPILDGLVADRLMDIPEARERYLSRFSELRTNVLTSEKLMLKVEKLQRRLRPVLEQLGPRLAEKFDIAAEGFRLQITHRVSDLEWVVEDPALNPVRFDGAGLMLLTAWRPENDYGNHELGVVTNSATGIVELHVKAGSDGDCTASWRTNFVLGPGQYRFEGRARCAGVVPKTGPKGDGVGIRASGGERSGANQLVRDTGWTDLVYEFDFDVRSRGDEVELLCELRANSGEAWFDLSSLRLRQLSREPRPAGDGPAP